MLRRFFTLFSTQVFVGVILLLNSLIVARLLGPVEKGKVALLIFVPTILVVILTLGIHSGLAYFLSRKEYPPHEVFGTALGMAGVLGCGTLFAGILILPSVRQIVFRDLPTLEVVTSLICVPALLMVYHFEGLWVAADNLRAAISVRLCLVIVYFLSGMLLVGWLHLGAWGGILAFALGNYSSAAMSCMWAIRSAPQRLTFSFDLLKQALTFGLPVYANTLADFGLYRMDTFMISYLLRFQDIGVYSIAVPLAELIWYLSSAMRPVLFASTARAGVEEANSVTPTILRGMLAMALILAALIFAGGYIVINLFLPVFIPVVPVLAILLLATTVALIFQLILTDMTGRRLGGRVSQIGVISLGFGIVFYIVLVPQFGIIGAAFASLLSYSFQSVIALLWFWKLTDLSPLEVLTPRQTDIVLLSDLIKRVVPRA